MQILSECQCVEIPRIGCRGVFALSPPRTADTLCTMTKVLLVVETPWARNGVHAALTTPEFEIIDHEDPQTAAAATVANRVDVAVVDLQIAAMGGMAVARAVRDASTKNGAETPVVILIDRAADAFIAKRAGAAAWVTKPTVPHELRAAIRGCVSSPEI